MIRQHYDCMMFFYGIADILKKRDYNNMESNKNENVLAGKRLSYLDILRGIGIILVVFAHIYINNHVVYDWIYSFHMPLFFLAAGMVYKEKAIWIDLKRRIQTIVLPYFCFGIPTLIYWQLIERKFRDSDEDFMTAVFGLVSGQYDYLAFNVHLWFLPCFFIVVTLFNVFVHIGGRRFAVIVSIIMSLSYIIVPLPALPWGIDRAFRFIVFYAAGSIFSQRNAEKIIDEHSISVKICVAVILLGINFILSYFSLNSGIMWFVTAFIGTTSMLIASVLIKGNRALEYFGKISLAVLCIHGPVYRILIKLVSIPLRVSADTVRANIFLSLIVTAFTLGICAIACQIIDRFTPWMIGKIK